MLLLRVRSIKVYIGMWGGGGGSGCGRYDHLSPPHFDLFGEFMNGGWYPQGSIYYKWLISPTEVTTPEIIGKKVSLWQDFTENRIRSHKYIFFILTSIASSFLKPYYYYYYYYLRFFLFNFT